jgi:ABC-2 type transport system permease protein
VTAVASYRAEALKLRKRPAVWILLATMGAVVLLFGYLLLYLVAVQAPESLGGVGAAALLDVLRPAGVPLQVLSMVSGFGSAIGLILGALTFGSEYSWRTVTTMAIQGPRRTPLTAGRIAAVLQTCLVLGLAAFAGGAAGAALVALLEPGDTTPPPVTDVAAAYGAAVLIIAVWCAIGLCLATLFRGTGWAIGIGLLYALAVESVISALPLGGRIGDVVAQALIGTNAAALTFAVAPQQAGVLGQAATVDIPVAQAVIVLTAYLLVALTVTVLVFRRRDIAG